MKIAILITCFNRKNTTLNCIQKVMDSDFKVSADDIFVVDGGSTDGTVSALMENFPNLNVEVREGFYWNQGMIAAWKLANSTGVLFDAFLLLNDDVSLHAEAIDLLVEIVERGEGRKLAVGFTISPSTGKITYGGLKRDSRISRLKFQLTADNNDDISTMNGNCVLVSRRIYEKLGFLNSKFQHSFGDIDYGLRATNEGFGIEITRSPVANLEANQTLYSSSKKLGFVDLYAVITDPKGVPPREWFYFTRVHAGILWPINFGFRYLKLLKWKS